MKLNHCFRVTSGVIGIGVGIGSAFCANPAQAALLSFSVEPIIGYELVQKVLPTAHTKNRILYGARATAGFLLLSAELEYTHATDSESYPDQDLLEKDTDEKIKLGARSTFRLSSLISLAARAGCQAKQNTHEETTGGATTTTISPISYKPYGGAELRGQLTSHVSAYAGVVVVFNDIHDMNQNEYQSTAGFAIRFP